MRTLLIFMILAVTACSFHHEPKDNSDFITLTDFSILEGTYINLGESSDETAYMEHRLSEIIWKNKEFNTSKDVAYNHSDIELINVTSNNDKLIVKAIINNCAIYIKSYVKDKDIHIKNGSIVVDNSFAMTSSVHVGPTGSTETIGIDQQGNGKFLHSEYGAGLIYLLVPFYLSGTEEVRFIKQGNISTFQSCKTANKSLKQTD